KRINGFVRAQRHAVHSRDILTRIPVIGTETDGCFDRLAYGFDWWQKVVSARQDRHGGDNPVSSPIRCRGGNQTVDIGRVDNAATTSASAVPCEWKQHFEGF